MLANNLGHMLVNWQCNLTFWPFNRFFLATAQKQKHDSKFPKYHFLSARGNSWHKNEIKLIRRGHYSSNDFQDSTKRKIAENKTLVYLPRVILFNAFQLGAEKGYASSNIK